MGLTTRCTRCHLVYDYEPDEVGTTLKCECGSPVLLPPPKDRLALIRKVIKPGRSDKARATPAPPTPPSVIRVPAVPLVQRQKPRIVFEDRAGPMPQPPKIPFFHLGSKIENVAMHRFKLLTHDPDTQKDYADTIELSQEITIAQIEEVIRKNGRDLHGVILIDRYWEQQSNMSTAEKVLTTIGIASLFLD